MYAMKIDSFHQNMFPVKRIFVVTVCLYSKVTVITECLKLKDVCSQIMFTVEIDICSHRMFTIKVIFVVTVCLQ